MKRLLSVFLVSLIFFSTVLDEISNTGLAQTKSDARQIVVEMSASQYLARASIQLAPSKFFAIEFPLTDSITFVTIQDEAALKMDDGLKQAQNPKLPVVIRAAEGWNSSVETTSLMVQMQSGAVLMLDIEPASTNPASIDRIVWRYNSETVALARDAAFSVPGREALATIETGRVSNGFVQVIAPPDAPDVVAADTLANTTKMPDGIFPQFQATDKKSDFILSSPPSRWIQNGKLSVTVVAVKNKSKNVLQLVSTPTLQIETTSKKKVSINNQLLVPLAVKTTADREPIIIAQDDVVYFSFVYETPVLGVNQRLLFGVAQTNAADRPAYLPIRPGASF